MLKFRRIFLGVLIICLLFYFYVFCSGVYGLLTGDQPHNLGAYLLGRERYWICPYVFYFHPIFVTAFGGISSALLAWIIFGFRKNTQKVEDFLGFMQRKFFKKKDVLRITTDAAVLCLLKQNSEAAVIVRWDKIVSVAAFKWDLFSIDRICLVFETKDRYLFAHEELPGWKELLAVLPERLEGILPIEKWWNRVAFPAFFPNKTKIFTRKTAE